MKEIQVHSLQESKELAKRLALCLKDKDALITLSGDLGAGKTTFTKALGAALGVEATINSPTFTILKSYRMADGRPLHHIDAYRLEGVRQELGFEECFEEGVCVIEWPQFLKDCLPASYLAITIKNGMDEERSFQLEGKGKAYAEIVEELA